MRLYLKLTKNTEVVKFDYQTKLVGTLHKWLGENKYHDGLSLYSLSWLNGESSRLKTGFNFKSGAEFFISSPDENFIKKIAQGVLDDPKVCFGMKVNAIEIKETPSFGSEVRFNVSSPVFIKRKIESRQKFYFFNEIESDELLTESMKTKMSKFGLESDGLKISFDRDYLNPKIKASTYNNVKNKGSVCPIIIEGTPEQIGFAWNVGVGNSTGIGFGSLA